MGFKEMKYLKLFEDSSNDFLENKVDDVVFPRLEEHQDYIMYEITHFGINNNNYEFEIGIEERNDISVGADNIIEYDSIIEIYVKVSKYKLKKLMGRIKDALLDEIDEFFEEINYEEVINDRSYDGNWFFGFTCKLKEESKRSIDTGLWDLKK